MGFSRFACLLISSLLFAWGCADTNSALSDREKEDIGQKPREMDDDDPGVTPGGNEPEQNASELTEEETIALCINVINTRERFERSVKFRMIQSDLLALYSLVNDENANAEICQNKAEDLFEQINSEVDLVDRCPENVQQMFDDCDMTLAEINECLDAKENQVESVFGTFTCSNFEEAIETVEDAVNGGIEIALPEPCIEVGQSCPWVLTAYD